MKNIACILDCPAVWIIANKVDKWSDESNRIRPIGREAKVLGMGPV